MWLLLDAQSLYRSALVQPLGTRRTVAVTILRPISAVSTRSRPVPLVAAADAALGHSVGGGPPLATVAPGARLRVPPPPPVRRRRPGAAPTTTTTTFPVLTARPTAADPLRVLVVGDSIGIDLGHRWSTT